MVFRKNISSINTLSIYFIKNMAKKLVVLVNLSLNIKMFWKNMH